MCGQAPGSHAADAVARSERKLPSGEVGVWSQSQATKNGEAATGFSLVSRLCPVAIDRLNQVSGSVAMWGMQPPPPPSCLAAPLVPIMR